MHEYFPFVAEIIILKGTVGWTVERGCKLWKGSTAGARWNAKVEKEISHCKQLLAFSDEEKKTLVAKQKEVDKKHQEKIMRLMLELGDLDAEKHRRENQHVKSLEINQ